MRGAETHKGERGRTNLQITVRFIQATDYPIFRIHTGKHFLVLE